MPDTARLQAMIAAVQRHARENYETNGWDYVIECWSSDEIREAIQEGFFNGEPVRDEADAIKRVGEVCELLDGVRRDVRGEIF
jgi:hypothetical protein